MFIDGKQIEKISHLDFQANPQEIPRVKLEVVDGIDFEGQAEVNFLKDPFTVRNACKILRDELMKHEDLYKAFSASIYSALKEMPEEVQMGDICTDEAVNYILRRIIEED